MFRVVFAVSGLHTCGWHPARLQSWSWPRAARAHSTVHHDVTGHDCGPALPEDDKPFLAQDSQGVLQCRDPHALKRAYLLDREQRFTRREHPGADRVPKRVGHLLPGQAGRSE